MRESEARYRTLVEHAPEVILVFDVDRGRFVDVNDNACRFFKMDASACCEFGPEQLAPRRSPAPASFGAAARPHRGSARRRDAGVRVGALRAATGQVMPCEVRFVRLPSSNRRLIRASITDITERKRAEADRGRRARRVREDRRQCAAERGARAIGEVIERVLPTAAAPSTCSTRSGRC